MKLDMKFLTSCSLACVLYLVLTFSLLKPVAAACCPCSIYGTCGDSQGCPAFECCGLAPCNIFCCNCDGNCRGGKALGPLWSSSSSNPSEKSDANLCMSKFNAVDENQDGQISFLEWAQSRDAFAHLSLEILSKRWRQYDWEGKGYLTQHEAINRKSSPSETSSKSSEQSISSDVQSISAAINWNEAQQSQKIFQPDDLSEAADLPATASRWILTYYTDNNCTLNAHRVAGTKSTDCTNIPRMRSFSFTQTGRFSLKVYPHQNCQDNPESYRDVPVCEKDIVSWYSYGIDDE